MRIAVLGCGSIGQRHLRNLQTLDVSSLIAFDPDPGRLAGLDHSAVETTSTLADVWVAQPDAVVVASPSHLHLDQAAEAVRHGCHLFVEKPVSHTTAGLEPLEHAAADLGLTTMVGCNMRFHPGPATVKRLLDTGAIGRPLFARLQTGSYLPEWRPATDYRQSYSASRNFGGGALLDCIHEVDLALWYFGAGRLEASSVRDAGPIGLNVDGLAELLIAHDDQRLSSVHLNFIQRDYKRQCQIVGDGGTLYWDFHEPLVRIVRGSDIAIEHLAADWPINQMYVDELSHFVSAVQRRTATMCPLAHGRMALEIALAARRHAEMTPISQ